MPAHPDFLAAFARGLGDGSLPSGLTARAPDETARRFAVYRNNVAVGLADALARRFPVIERLVGADYFRALARIYGEAHRPSSPVMMDWGDSFPDFLASFPPLAAFPYMADVARIECARTRAYHAADSDPMTPEELARADPSRVCLGLHASVQVLALTHPAVSIWTAHQPGRETRNMGAGPETALVLRDSSFAVPVWAIGPGDAALIGGLSQGQSLIAAAECAASAEAGHDPQPILVRLMQAGVITSPRNAT